MSKSSQSPIKRRLRSSHTLSHISARDIINQSDQITTRFEKVDKRGNDSKCQNRYKQNKFGSRYLRKKKSLSQNSKRDKCTKNKHIIRGLKDNNSSNSQSTVGFFDQLSNIRNSDNYNPDDPIQININSHKNTLYDRSSNSTSPSFKDIIQSNRNNKKRRRSPQNIVPLRAKRTKFNNIGIDCEEKISGDGNNADFSNNDSQSDQDDDMMGKVCGKPNKPPISTTPTSLIKSMLSHKSVKKIQSARKPPLKRTPVIIHSKHSDINDNPVISHNNNVQSSNDVNQYNDNIVDDFDKERDNVLNGDSNNDEKVSEPDIVNNSDDNKYADGINQSKSGTQLSLELTPSADHESVSSVELSVELSPASDVNSICTRVSTSTVNDDSYDVHTDIPSEDGGPSIVSSKLSQPKIQCDDNNSIDPDSCFNSQSTLDTIALYNKLNTSLDNIDRHNNIILSKTSKEIGVTKDDIGIGVVSIDSLHLHKRCIRRRTKSFKLREVTTSQTIDVLNDLLSSSSKDPSQSVNNISRKDTIDKMVDKSSQLLVNKNKNKITTYFTPKKVKSKLIQDKVHNNVVNDDNGIINVCPPNRIDKNHTCNQKHCQNVQSKMDARHINKNSKPQNCHGIVNKSPDKSIVDVNTLRDDQYQCANCHQIFITADPMLLQKEIRKYIYQFICPQCTKGKNGKGRKYTSYQCIEDDCHSPVKQFTTKYARVGFINHYKQHPTKDFLYATDRNICNDEFCTRVIGNPMLFCPDHIKSSHNQQVQQRWNNRNKMDIDNGDEDDEIIDEEHQAWLQQQYTLSQQQFYQYDIDGKKYNLKDTFRRYDVMKVRLSDQQKMDRGRVLANAFRLLSSGHNDINKCIDGGMMLRLYGPTFNHRPYRGDNSAKVKEERIRRQTLYHAKRWATLINIINTEQDKRDAKRERQRRKRPKVVSDTMIDCMMELQHETDNANYRDQYIQDNNMMDVEMDTAEKQQSKLDNINKYIHEDDDGNITINHIPLTIAEKDRLHNKIPYRPPSKNKLNDIKQQRNMSVIPNQAINAKQQIDKDQLKKKLKQYQFDRTDTHIKISERLQRAIKYAKMGYLKKADASLNQSKMADLYNDRIWRKVQDKYPAENIIGNTYSRRTKKMKLPSFRLTREMVQQVLENINVQASAGPGNISNDLINYIVKRETHTNPDSLVARLTYYMKVHIQSGIPKCVRSLLMYSHGISFLKDGKNDVRPICITSSLVRIIDKLTTINVPESVRRTAIGYTQMTDIKGGTEAAAMISQNISLALKDNHNLCVVNTDISNAFNTARRHQLMDYINQYLPDMRHHFAFLYDEGHWIDYSYGRHLIQTSGMIQGITSSSLWYCLLKRIVITNAHNEMMRQYPRFRVFAAVDYIDDGLELLPLPYASDYLQILSAEYKKMGMNLNMSKTKIIVDSPNNNGLQYIKNHLMDYRVNIRGNFTFLSISQGVTDYINKQMIDRMEILETKCRQIELIRSAQIRRLLYSRYMGHNKILYHARNTQGLTMWMERVHVMYQFIRNSILMHYKQSELINYQSFISVANGGLGMRQYRLVRASARLTAILHKDQIVNSCLLWKNASKLERQSVGNDIYEGLQRAYSYIRDYYTDEMHKMLDILNGYLSNKHQIRISYHLNQKQIMQQVDKENIDRFLRIGNDYDKARMLSLSANGCGSWMQAIPNRFFGLALSNMDEYILMGLRIGINFRINEDTCRKCQQVLDTHHYHALQCSKEGHVVMRHDAIVDRLMYWFKRAQYRVTKEARFDNLNNGNGNAIGNNNNNHNNHNHNNDNRMDIDGGVNKQRPGDLKIWNWFEDNRSDKSLYLDITIGNIFAKSYIKLSSRKRLYLAYHKEVEKKRKYKNNPNFKPIVMETMGGVGKEFKDILRHLACQISTLTNIDYSVMMNRIRTDLVSTLMKEQSRMIQASWRSIL